jgi:putative hydrolase of the HAD superfamily
VSRKTALIVDFGGVISKTLFETHDESEQVLGLAPGSLNWRGPFDPAHDALWQAMQRGEIHEHDYWNRRVAEVGRLKGETWTKLTEFTRRVRGADPNRAIRPEAIAALSRLRARGVKIVMLTNGMDEFYGADVRARMNVLALMDHIIDATYTKVMKPDRRAYQMALDVFKTEARDAVFVDDQPQHAEGGRAAGIDTVNFDVTHPADSWADVEARFA